jgi:glycine cleavage system H protein
MEVKDNLYYTKEHEWLKIEGNKGTIGITQYAANSLGDITFVEIVPPGTDIVQFARLGTIESVKAASDIFSPISGKVTSINSRVIDTPEIVNSSPYDDGWLATVEILKLEETKNLMTAEQYRQYIEKL